MKKNTLLGLLTSLIFMGLSNLSMAQSEIYGIWNASCAIEKTGKSSASFCEICPINKTTPGEMELVKFDIKVSDKSVKIGTKDSVAYTWDDNTSTIRFTFEKKEYAFAVLIVTLENINIWKDKSNNRVLVLKKP